MSSGPITTWPWRRGDGDVALAVAVARTDGDLDEAKRASHDFVVEQTGSLRAGPVHWVFFSREDGPQRLREIDIEPEPEMLAFLADAPHALIVVAMASTDAPQRRTA